MHMQAEIVYQGRHLSGWSQWIADHPEWSRQRLSRVLCQGRKWRGGRGQLNDFAAGSRLEKLAERGWIGLPPLQLQRSHPRPQPDRARVLERPKEPVQDALSELLPLQRIVPEPGQPVWHGFDAYVQTYH
jgi:hypothetical protein